MTMAKCSTALAARPHQLLVGRLWITKCMRAYYDTEIMWLNP